MERRAVCRCTMHSGVRPGSSRLAGWLAVADPGRRSPREGLQGLGGGGATEGWPGGQVSDRRYSEPVQHLNILCKTSFLVWRDCAVGFNGSPYPLYLPLGYFAQRTVVVIFSKAIAGHCCRRSLLNLIPRPSLYHPSLLHMFGRQECLLAPTTFFFSFRT